VGKGRILGQEHVFEGILGRGYVEEQSPGGMRKIMTARGTDLERGELSHLAVSGGSPIR